MQKRLDFIVVGDVEKLSVYDENGLKLVFLKMLNEYAVTDGVNEIKDHDYNIHEIFLEYSWLKKNLL